MAHTHVHCIWRNNHRSADERQLYVNRTSNGRRRVGAVVTATGYEGQRHSEDIVSRL